MRQVHAPEKPTKLEAHKAGRIQVILLKYAGPVPMGSSVAVGDIQAVYALDAFSAQKLRHLAEVRNDASRVPSRRGKEARSILFE
jgi:hypothetical protein